MRACESLLPTMKVLADVPALLDTEFSWLLSRCSSVLIAIQCRSVSRSSSPSCSAIVLQVARTMFLCISSAWMHPRLNLVLRGSLAMIAFAATSPSLVKNGCCVHCAALSLLSGSTTSSLETRSLASGEKLSSIGLYWPARTLYRPAMECSKGMFPLMRRYTSTPTAHMSDC